METISSQVNHCSHFTGTPNATDDWLLATAESAIASLQFIQPRPTEPDFNLFLYMKTSGI